MKKNWWIIKLINEELLMNNNLMKNIQPDCINQVEEYTRILVNSLWSHLHTIQACILNEDVKILEA